MSYVLCFHRWSGTQALYDQYERPGGLPIRAICTHDAVSSLPQIGLESYSVVDSLDDAPKIESEVNQITNKYGFPEFVIALNEGDLLTAAALRQRFQLSGDDTFWAERFRDKMQMSDIASKQLSVRVLQSAAAQTHGSIRSFADKIGYPMIVKPRFGTASRGVRVVNSPEELEEVELLDNEPMMMQEFCSSPICHIDGWWDGKEVVVGTASVYLNSCAEFTTNNVLGSIELPSSKDENRMIKAAEALLEVFSPGKELVFHLELFYGEDELTFLEIGARVGGAEIPFLWREVRNIDLIGIAWELQTNASSCYRDQARLNSLNGHPLSDERGAWVIANTQYDSVDSLSSIYWLQNGDIKNRASGVYEGAKIRVRLKCSQYDKLERDVNFLVEELTATHEQSVEF